jgi:HSP20 family molecular chaperone IbpA
LGQVIAVSVKETEDAYVVEMDLPGVKKDDISVELSGNELVVTGDLKDSADGQYKRRIRRSGHVEQWVLLPSAEADKVTASLSDGVLTMTVPRSDRLAIERHRQQPAVGACDRCCVPVRRHRQFEDPAELAAGFDRDPRALPQLVAAACQVGDLGGVARQLDGFVVRRA